MFENRVLRRIFGLKRDEVMGGWRRVKEIKHARKSGGDTFLRNSV
jgi:hypothetical protein